MPSEVLTPEDYIKRYEADIRKAANWYADLMPGGWSVGVDEMMQAGRIAVWNVAEKHPDKINIVPYVRAAIRYSIFGVIKEAIPRIPEIHVIRQDGEFVSLVDVLPSHEKALEERIDVDDLCHAISANFSQQEADSLRILVDNSRAIALNLDLVSPPKAEVKERVKLVTAMDLSDKDMLMYARVLVGERKLFPKRWFTNEKARKFIEFMIREVGLTPEDFVTSYGPREEMLETFRLHGVFQQVYNGNFLYLSRELAPYVEPWKIRHRGRWQGVDGLINAYDAMEDLQRRTGKAPRKLTQDDFMNAGMNGMLRSLFDNSHIVAVEFRWPGTYSDSPHKEWYEDVSSRAKRLWKNLEKSLRD